MCVYTLITGTSFLYVIIRFGKIQEIVWNTKGKITLLYFLGTFRQTPVT